MMTKGGKRYRGAAGQVDRTRKYELEEAIRLLKTFNTTKFDQTVEIAMRLGIDAKLSEQAVRGSVSLPKGTGKKVRVIAFCQGADIELAKQAGAAEAGADELVEKVQGGWLEFDVAVATPDMMPKVGKLGRLLGPKGLMPSPKSGTVSKDIGTTTREFIGGKIEFRNDDGGNLHAPVGRLSFTAEEIRDNVLAVVNKVRSMRPASAKGNFILKVVLTCTMGPGVEVNLN